MVVSQFASVAMAEFQNTVAPAARSGIASNQYGTSSSMRTIRATSPKADVEGAEALALVIAPSGLLRPRRRCASWALFQGIGEREAYEALRREMFGKQHGRIDIRP